MGTLPRSPWLEWTDDRLPDGGRQPGAVRLVHREDPDRAPTLLDSVDRTTLTEGAAESDLRCARVLRQRGGRGAAPAVEAGRLGGLEGAAEAMNQLLRKAGDGRRRSRPRVVRPTRPAGQLLWSSQAQASFMSALMRGCVPDGQSTTLPAGADGQRGARPALGSGEVQSPAFKGGWGPDPDGNTSSGRSAWSLRATVISMRSPSPPA